MRQTKTQIVGGTKPTEGWLSAPEVREGGWGGAVCWSKDAAVTHLKFCDCCTNEL